MFTASVFKDLLLPLFDDIKELFIYLPFKTTTDCSFNEDFKTILFNCGLNPECFNGSISHLNKSRKNIHTNPQSSIVEMYNYFIELEHISLRFSLKNFSFLCFNWYIIN